VFVEESSSGIDPFPSPRFPSNADDVVNLVPMIDAGHLSSAPHHRHDDLRLEY
jgi:hypothetical protein